ncbi:2'-5' RNA ligase family protein [Prauserella muralis]|uniref:2'-5' RNA ligase n=1 Tax=Prauserella muralis TaxID=588067 RepID=A0A2V4AZ77_9PSEU|nr:2'-5' RNA ligase family protein [Prauserella muralis]PXY27216.1 2'-5' RNA ligase [Prauserella muralis]TWE23128.1 2'-5' RNA ligase [Prauserella muralis]
MALGVCLLFDGRSERALRNLWHRLEQHGLPTLASHTHGRHHPHLSYVVLLDWDLDAVRASVESLPVGGPFELTFDAVTAFRRGRVALVPGVPAELARRQQAVVQAVRATGALVHRHYEPGRWLPHSSLVTRAATDLLPQVAAAAYEVLPLTVRVTRAALVDSAEGRLWPLDTLP